MSHVPVWFERKFEFTFPVEQYPNLCVRLRGTPARLEEIMRGAAPDLLVVRREGNWSAQEHAGHLLDLESLWMARLDDFLADGNTLTVADLSNRRTHEANHNNRDLEDILAAFRLARLQRSTVLRNSSRLSLRGPCCILVCSSPCVWWITSSSSLSTTIITWHESGS